MTEETNRKEPILNRLVIPGSLLGLVTIISMSSYLLTYSSRLVNQNSHWGW